MSTEKFYTKREEKANWITHAIGLVMGLGTAIILSLKAISNHNPRAFIAYAIFSLGIIICMGSSTLYHYVQHPKRKALLRHFDHASIYLLIAASYSPFTLILLRHTPFWNWFLFTLVWLIALGGILNSFRPLKRNSHLKTISYVAMGLIVLIAFNPLIEAAKAQNAICTIVWLVAGGIFYIVGAIIYATAKREFIHALFHIFVLLGLACHIYATHLIPL